MSTDRLNKMIEEIVEEIKSKGVFHKITETKREYVYKDVFVLLEKNSIMPVQIVIFNRDKKDNTLYYNGLSIEDGGEETIVKGHNIFFSPLEKLVKRLNEEKL